LGLTISGSTHIPNLIPSELNWDYGENEKFDDQKKLAMLGAIRRTTAVPYSTRVKIVAPIINKLLDTPVNDEDLVAEYNQEIDKINVEFGEV
jgi:hypothetical protein